jgi:hypothetical protein
VGRLLRIDPRNPRSPPPSSRCIVFSAASTSATLFLALVCPCWVQWALERPHLRHSILTPMLPSLTNQYLQQKPQDPHMPCPVRGHGDTGARPPRSSNEPRRRADTAPYDIGQPKIQAPVAIRPQHRVRCEEPRGGSASEFSGATAARRPLGLTHYHRLADAGTQGHFKEPTSLHEFEFSTRSISWLQTSSAPSALSNRSQLSPTESVRPIHGCTARRAEKFARASRGCRV